MPLAVLIEGDLPSSFFLLSLSLFSGRRGGVEYLVVDASAWRRSVLRGTDLAGKDKSGTFLLAPVVYNYYFYYSTFSRINYYLYFNYFVNL
jgi:hypothetical protein